MLRGLSRAIPFLLMGSALASSSALAATLLYTNDVLGEIEPCGCKANPYGGMVRKAGLAARIRKAGEKDLLQVDAGNLLFDSETIPTALAPQWKTQARELLRAHVLIAPLVLTPGPKDFALGMKGLRDATPAKGVNWISMNLRQNGKAPFPEENRVQLGRVSLALLGYSGPLVNYGSGVSALPQIEALQKRVHAAKKRGDRVLLLSHQGVDADRELARKVTGIDWIIGANSQSFLTTPIEEGKTRIFQSSFRNQYVGVLKLNDQGELIHHELVGLDETFETFAPAAMKKLVEKWKAETARVNSKTILKREGRDMTATFKSHVTCFECHERQYDHWRRTDHVSALTPLLRSKQLRNMECLSCHTVGQSGKGGYSSLGEIAALKSAEKPVPWPIEEVEAFHRELKSANSLESKVILKRLNPATAPLADHLRKISHDFGSVQCESCHGAAGKHPFEGGFSRKITQQTCLNCHTSERAPSWYREGRLDASLFAKKMKLVACPKDHGDADPGN